MFSRRFPGTQAPNRLTALLADKRARGVAVLDLTESNPTRAGIEYDDAEILAALAHPAALTYEPDPRGLPLAREAVVAYYARRGLAAHRDQLHLTASTSEAYAYLMKLLCEPGDALLVPRPSYPLLDALATAEAVNLATYPLVLEAGHQWRVDLPALRQAVTARTRAIVVVHPNNPTGSMLRHAELSALEQLCAEADLALIADEVFGDYVNPAIESSQTATANGSPDGVVPSLMGASRALTFVLSGLSKVVGLPQLKLGWIHICGPPPLRARAQDGLDWIADAFLSVGTPIQLALPQLLERQPSMRQRIRARIEGNQAMLERVLATAPSCRLLPREGGWYATLEIPRVPTDEEWALRLLEEDDLLVQPGYFFDFEGEGHLVLSLLTQPDTFEMGVARLARRLARS